MNKPEPIKLLILLVMAFISHAGDVHSVPTPSPSTERPFSHRISSYTHFQRFSERKGDEEFLKFVINIQSGEIHFFDVKAYPLHKDFVFREIYKETVTPARLDTFQENYTSQKNDYLLCYLTHHLRQDLWTFAFWEGDLISLSDVKLVWKVLGNTFYDVSNLRFRPDSNWQERVMKGTKAIPFMLNTELYSAADYRMFYPGKVVGRLRLHSGDDLAEEALYGRRDIVVVQYPLLDLPPVAGIISENFSSPLSHINLRASSWGIPNIGLKHAANKLESLIGKMVFFDASEADYTLRLATEEEVNAHSEDERPKLVSLPKADLSKGEILRLDQLRSSASKAYGAKASHLGELMHHPAKGYTVPNGIAIPFSHYHRHLKRHGLLERITSLVDTFSGQSPSKERTERLQALRNEIVAAPFDAALLASIRMQLSKFSKDQGYFVRSSTNAEDLDNFSGAGLYDTVPNVAGEEAIAHAIKEVWASVWNERAFSEREHYGINHQSVYGGVLIQQGINAQSAGVLVTTHPSDLIGNTIFTINAKHGLGLRVVQGKKIPEILLFDSTNNGIRIISRSNDATQLNFSEHGGVKEVTSSGKVKPVLTDSQVKELGKMAVNLLSLFPSKSPLDIEWLFEGNELYVVQVRHFIPLRK